MDDNNVSIFSKVFDSMSNISNREKPTATPPVPKDGITSLEDYQQQYLDWQVTKIAHDVHTKTVYYDADRLSAYQDFRAMDMSPEITAALNIIRDECLQRNEYGNILQIYSENDNVKKILTDLFKKNLNIEYNLRLWIRELLKYGDYFVHLHIDKDKGVYNFTTLPQEEMHREEGYDKTNPHATRFRWENSTEYFESWQIAHFRLIEDTKRLPYGRSRLDSSRKIWKQLQLAEDAMLVYRLTRAPERRVFYIDVGSLDNTDVATFMQKIQNETKKQPIVNQRNGNVNYRYDPMNVTEDFYIPIRGEKSSKIETLPGASNMADIMDIEYTQNKLFAALEVPKTYLNYSQNLPGGPTLSQADLRFARTITSIQEVVLMELKKIATIHLMFMKQFEHKDNFELKLTNPSTQQELLKLETIKARLDVFERITGSNVFSPTSYTWAMRNVLGFSNKDIKKMLIQKKVESKIFLEIEDAKKTYKKIGLFDDIDRKFENPNAEQQLRQADEEGYSDEPGGGGSPGGGGGGGGELSGNPLGSLDLSANDAGAGAGTGGSPSAAPSPSSSPSPEPAAENPISESYNSSIDFLLETLDDIERQELPSDSAEDSIENMITENTLITQSMNYELDSLIKQLKNEEGDFSVKNKYISLSENEEMFGFEKMFTIKETSEQAKRILNEIEEQINDSTSLENDIEFSEDE